MGFRQFFFIYLIISTGFHFFSRRTLNSIVYKILFTYMVDYRHNHSEQKIQING